MAKNLKSQKGTIVSFYLKLGAAASRSTLDVSRRLPLSILVYKEKEKNGLWLFFCGGGGGVLPFGSGRTLSKTDINLPYGKPRCKGEPYWSSG